MKQLILLLTIIGFIGCTGPRAATMCLSSKTGTYVKCPKGYEPGDVIVYENNK